MKLLVRALLFSVTALPACTDSNSVAPKPRLSQTSGRTDVVSNPPDPNGPPPTLEVSTLPIVEATGPSGAPVTIQVASVDNAGNALIPTCNGAVADATGVVTLQAAIGVT